MFINDQVEVNTMYFDVLDAKVTRHLEFFVTFSDGLSGAVKMLPTHLYGVFDKLKDLEFFNRLAG